MTGARVLVVDDDPAILRSVGRALAGQSYEVQTLAEGAEVADVVRRTKPDVVLLDLVLPDIDGIEVCRRIRETSDTSVIVVSALGDDERKVQALDIGADDYVTKPFSMPELLARIRVTLRHQTRDPVEPVLAVGPVRLDVATHAVSVDGQPVHLTPTEFELCRLLLQHEGQLLTQRWILQRVWGPEYVEDSHILRTFVHQLRSKLAAATPEAGAMLKTEPGVGYRMVGGIER